MKKSNKKKGASLIIVLMVLAIAMILSSVTLTTISRTTKANASEKKSEDLLYSAESGLQYGIVYFNKYKNDFDSIPKERNLLPSDSVFYKDIDNVDVRIVYDTRIAKYKIESTAKLKTDENKKRIVSKTINRIETPGGGGGEMVLESPASLIVPKDGDILFNGIKRVDVYGINEQYELYDVLNYKDKKIYEQIIKNQGGNGSYAAPKLVSKDFGTNFDIEFKEHSLTPFNYLIQTISIPSNGVNKDIEINNKTVSTYFNGNTNTLICNKTVNINADWQGRIDLNNVSIYANKIIIKGNDNNVNLTNVNLVANSIVFQDSKDKIFKSSEFLANEISINTTGNTVFDNVVFNSTKINVSGNKKYFKNGTKITSKDFDVNTGEETSFTDVSIKSENFNLKQSGMKTIVDSQVTVNNFNISITDGSKIEKSIITCGVMTLSGSCNKVFGNTIITANKFKLSSSDSVYFKDVNLFLNNFEVTGSNARSFENSIVISNNVNINTSDKIEFNNTLIIAQKFYFYAQKTYIYKFNNGTFDDKFKRAQEHLIITGQSKPSIITYEIDDDSLDYSSS